MVRYTIISLSRIADEAILVSTQDGKTVPFEIKRAYVISKIKRSSVRGKHAHKITKQALFCIQGSMSVTLDDGKERKTIRLNKPEKGILIDNMVWHEMNDFSFDATLLILASEYFKKSDYIRDYDIFLRKLKHTL